jgi:predicted extracellular nuclease
VAEPLVFRERLDHLEDERHVGLGGSGNLKLTHQDCAYVNNSTADNTLRRSAAVTDGDTDGSDPFDPALEWVGFAQNTFDGLGSRTGDGIPPPPPPAVITAEIWDIQGAGAVSPLVGSVRRTSGIVTAVFSSERGFFIQDAEGDGNANTSDGLFVFTGSAPAVAVGDAVEVIGGVTEFFEMTELMATQIIVNNSGHAPIPAVTFDANTPSPTQRQPIPDMERFEGMLVEVVDGTVSSPTNQFNEASVVATDRRAFREPGIAFPGVSGLPVWDGNPEIFEIDTDMYAQSPRLQSQVRLLAGDDETLGRTLDLQNPELRTW